MLDVENPDLKFAYGAVRQAALLARQVQREIGLNTRAKEDLSPITVGDLSAQALVVSLLLESFPGETLVAEEDADFLRSPEGKTTLDLVTSFVSKFVPLANSGKICDWIDYGRSSSGNRYWTLDPIDGTKGYVRGGQYVCALAHIVDGRVVLGALGCPGINVNGIAEIGGDGSVILAQLGKGAWVTSLDNPSGFSRLHVSDCASPACAKVLRSQEDTHTNPEEFDRLMSILSVEPPAVRMDSQAKYAVLAAGQGDAMMRMLPKLHKDHREKVWDIAAGSIVLEEAGGKVTDLDGKALDFHTGRLLSNNRGLLATNGALHAAFLQALGTAGF